MIQIYRKLAESSASPTASSAVHDAVLRADAHLEEHFLSPAAKHAESLARTAMRTSLSRLDPLFSRVMGTEGTPSAAEDEHMERVAAPRQHSGGI